MVTGVETILMVFVLDCAFALLVVSQVLQVGLYCLPLVPRDRVSPAPLKFLMTASLLHRFNILFDRFRLYCDWLLAWLVPLMIMMELACPINQEASRETISKGGLELTRHSLLVPRAITWVGLSESVVAGPDSNAAMGGDLDVVEGSDSRLVQNSTGLDDCPDLGAILETWNMNDYNLGRTAIRDTFCISDPSAFGPGSPARQGAEHE